MNITYDMINKDERCNFVDDKLAKPPTNEDNTDNEQYQSRKPKWWTQLAGRRGTKAQRHAIQRMTDHGYCISKELLTDFSRVNNRSNKTNNGIDAVSDEWKRGWWDRALAISNSTFRSVECVHLIKIGTNEHNEKYTQKFQDMIKFSSILPCQEYSQKWLEIGFGQGSNLYANAQKNPRILYLGSEIHQPGIGILAQKIEEGLKKDNAVENLRILPGDGIKLLYHLPNNYLDVILITFPDPWPKEFHAKWRVIQLDTLREMKRVLRKDGRVFVATDAKCFNIWSREIFSKESTAWKEVIPCPPRETWLPIVSYYEQKGINEGRQTMLQCWQAFS